MNTKKDNSTKKPKKNTPHDGFVKKFMENPIAAGEFLDEYLPVEFKEFVDLATLKVEKESYVEDSLKKRLSDLVYSVSTRDNSQAFVYLLLEHQSEPDYWISLRLWKYSLLLLERHTKDENKLPLILPLVIYNGKVKYTAPKNIWKLFDNPTLAQKAMSEDYRLIDLQAMSDNDIDYEKHSSIVKYVMKHIRDRDLLKMLSEAMKRCHNALLIDKQKDYIHLKSILWYTDARVDEEKKQELEQLIVDNLPKEDSEDVMRTIAQAYIEQGEAKGREEERFKNAIKMLEQNIDLNVIQAVTGLSLEQLKKLKRLPKLVK